MIPREILKKIRQIEIRTNRVSLRWLVGKSGIVFSLLLLCSCATERSSHPHLATEVAINKDAGRGGLLFIMLRLENVEELPFVLDTGSPGTLFDKSLIPKLGKRLPLGRWTVSMPGDKQKSGL